MEKIAINEQELAIINAFCGYGSLQSANIIFLGSEEGLDHKNIQEVIRIRMKRALQNIPIDGKDILNGHYMIDHDEDSSGKIIQMIQYQSRLLLHLNFPEESWFEPSGNNKETWKRIKEYHYKHIYHEGLEWKLRSALTELRPLPRRNEGEWPFSNLDREAYIEAFRFSNHPILNPAIKQLKDSRVEILRNVFSCAEDLKLIIGIGDKESKRRFFEAHFSAMLKLIDISGRTYFTGEVKSGTRNVHVILSDFFGNGQVGLKDLKGIAEYIQEREILAAVPLQF